MPLITYPDGTKIRASPISERRDDDSERDYGLYCDAQWNPTWPATVIDWPDFGLPSDPNAAATDIAAAFDRARLGELVEVGCLGGRGRTGTVLACMAVLAGVPGDEAVAWIRQAYRREAVETPEQEEWVLWFAEWASQRRAG